jgi:RNA polymerase sigma-70 factor, ECF subfamily
MPASKHAKDLESLSDVELMKLVKNGPADPFAVLVRRHQNFLVNFFRSLGVYTDAEDLVQDTFVRLYRYRQRYQPTAKFTTFLCLMGRQVWIDSLRRKKRRDELNESLTRESEALEKEAVSGFGAQVDVEKALGHLPEGMRSVVMLNVYQGLKYQEIADLMEIPLGTVKSRMFQALNRLREILDVGGK